MNQYYDYKLLNNIQCMPKNIHHHKRKDYGLILNKTELQYIYSTLNIYLIETVYGPGAPMSMIEL